MSLLDVCVQAGIRSHFIFMSSSLAILCSVHCFGIYTYVGLGLGGIVSWYCSITATMVLESDDLYGCHLNFS